MPPVESPSQTLAGRLRQLRTECWPGRTITQNQLARALSVEESTSVPLISSWESRRSPAVPPPNRLEAYARFFATERSVARQPFRLFAVSDLAEHERVRHDQLLRELTDLRNAALGHATSTGFWSFPPFEDVTIVCGDAPEERRDKLPYANPDSPDYEELYNLTDISALIELHGHIRAANPTNQVNIRSASESKAEDHTTHLVLLGGVDFNVVARYLLDELLDIPVRQVARETECDSGGFEVTEAGKTRLLRPVMRGKVLVEDIAHVYRGPNPLNEERTVTICNGMFGRGTLGAARVFTDASFRQRNEEYVRARFADISFFSIITRVPIVNRKVVTPDWSRPDTRLHEWPASVSAPPRVTSAPADQAGHRRAPQLLGC